MYSNNSDSSLVEISQLIGSGKVYAQSGDKLIFTRSGGEGILWPVMIDQIEYWLWCDENQWCEWISPIVSIKGVDDISPDMLAVAVELLSGEMSMFTGKKITWKIPVKGCVRQETGPTFFFHRETRWLECRLLSWPIDVIRGMTHDWHLLEEDAHREVLSCTATLQVGIFKTSLNHISQWQLGDGLVISQVAKLSDGQLWFCFDNVRFLMTQSAPGEFVMEEYIDESHATSPDDNNVSVNDIYFTVSVEVGHVSLRMSELLNLKPGDCISGVANIEQDVSLNLQGRKIGRGNLLKVNDQWVVRISEIG